MSREFELVGEGGTPTNGFFSIIVTDVSDLYQSNIPLIASRKLGMSEDWQTTADFNKDIFLNPDTWRVSQYKGVSVERVGIRYFKMVRMDVFNELWKKPIRVSDYNLRLRHSPNLFKIPGKHNEWGNDQGFQLYLPKAQETLRWLYKYKPMVYIFTDDDRMFVDPEDDLAYIADVLNAEE